MCVYAALWLFGRSLLVFYPKMPPRPNLRYYWQSATDCEVMMDALLFALFCIVLPLWLFAGLYLGVEIADSLKKRAIKKLK